MTENGMEGVVTSIMPFLKVRLISMALIVSLQRSNYCWKKTAIFSLDYIWASTKQDKKSRLESKQARLIN